MKLAELQAFVAEAVRREAPLPTDPAMTERAATVTTGNARLSPVEQLDVYREQFFLRHLSSLREDFPTLIHLLGRDEFDRLARAYLAAHPPDVRAYSMRDLAAEVGPFLERTAPWSADPLLADCARTEWAFIEAFDAPDAPPLDPSALTTMPEDAWASAVVGFHPAMRLLSLRYPAHDFRAAVRRGEKPARPEPAPAHVVVFRTDHVQYVDVEPLALELLSRLARGEPLGPACEAIAAVQGDVESKLGTWFSHWTQYAWIRELRSPRPPSRPRVRAVKGRGDDRGS